MSDDLKSCPNCKSSYAYAMGNDLYACPKCYLEWNPNEVNDEDKTIVKDVNGNLLVDEDAVIVIKDLPVKGAPKPIKKGTKVKNIRLKEGDHNIDSSYRKTWLARTCMDYSVASKR